MLTQVIYYFKSTTATTYNLYHTKLLFLTTAVIQPAALVVFNRSITRHLTPAVVTDLRAHKSLLAQVVRLQFYYTLMQRVKLLVGSLPILPHVYKAKFIHAQHHLLLALPLLVLLLRPPQLNLKVMVEHLLDHLSVDWF